MSRSRLTLHHSGVEQPFLDAGRETSEPGRHGLLFVGSWIERKGILDLVPAMSRVLEAKPDATFTVAGCNCPADVVLSGFPEIVRPRVRVIPFLGTTDELIRVYRSHAVLVLPSYFEGQPLVMIEAAALGLPIITTPICGMLDFVEHGVNGLFAPVGDRERLYGAIMDLVANPQKAAQMGERAQKSAADHSWRSAAAKIEDAYFDALASTARGSP
jgi:glycosyltransferase involved in cell wall biosynthesis